MCISFLEISDHGLNIFEVFEWLPGGLFVGVAHPFDFVLDLVVVCFAFAGDALYFVETSH